MNMLDEVLRNRKPDIIQYRLFWDQLNTANIPFQNNLLDKLLSDSRMSLPYTCIKEDESLCVLVGENTLDYDIWSNKQCKRINILHSNSDLHNRLHQFLSEHSRTLGSVQMLDEDIFYAQIEADFRGDWYFQHMAESVQEYASSKINGDMDESLEYSFMMDDKHVLAYAVPFAPGFVVLGISKKPDYLEDSYFIKFLAMQNANKIKALK